MKACAACGRLFPDDAGFCPVDGATLADVAETPPPPDERDRRVGTSICGRYECRRVVADGGTGRVYEALDVLSGRHVAVKVLHRDVAEDEVALQRFRREFEVSRRLSHEHVVEVLNFAPTEDHCFALVMEFLHGEELRGTLQRERTLAPDRLVRIVSQVAFALDEAHRLALVHRDLKPDNLFLCQTREGDSAKILDFGSVRDNAASARKLTVVGTTIGTPFYMAPEQAQGLDTLDQRADVWALGAIVYECVTGQIPFSGTNGPSVLFAILTAAPPRPSRLALRAGRPIPAAVDAALAGALRKAPAQRTATAGEFADALGRAFGLDGDHREWRRLSQLALSERIRDGMARQPPVLASVPPSRPPGPVAPRAGVRAAPAFEVRGEPAGIDAAPTLASGGAFEANLRSMLPALVVGVLALAVGALVAWLVLGG